jgi:hypothetical protein
MESIKYIMSYTNTNILRIVFQDSAETAPYTKCGSFTNTVVSKIAPPRVLDNMAKKIYNNNMLESEKQKCIGYLVDDDSFPFDKIPAGKIKQIKGF